MSYTVKELAKISGVSVRTLHWYDEIGLLKPAYYGANQFRYYEEEQLLRLQQILFFRELGFKLNAIQKVIQSESFDQIKTLKAHRRHLEECLDHKRSLIQVIDQTILRLKDCRDMEDRDLYKGLGEEKRKWRESYAVRYQGTVSEEVIAEKSPQGQEGMSEKEKSRVQREGRELLKAFTERLEQGMTPRCEEVQKLVQIYYHFMESVHDAAIPAKNSGSTSSQKELDSSVSSGEAGEDLTTIEGSDLINLGTESTKLGILTRSGSNVSDSAGIAVHDVNEEVYIAYSQMYRERPEFREQLDEYHLELAEFLSEAMRVYLREKRCL